MTNVDESEWNDMINNLNKGKAPGVSEISYDLIGKSGEKFLDIFRNLINECLQQTYMPKAQQKAQIYPIPKPDEWKGNINKTRPITLLECGRKMLFKILTNRLNKILATNYNILRNNNFAALPGRST